MSMITCPYCGRAGAWIETHRAQVMRSCLGCGQEWTLPHDWWWGGPVGLVLLGLAAFLLGTQM